MLTYEEIINLSKAGFSNEQVVALCELASKGMAKAEVTPSAPIEQDKTNEVMPTEAAAEPEEAPQPEAQPQVNELQSAIVKLTQSIDEMKASNIRNSEQPKRESVDDILARIIAPPKKD